MEWQLIISIFIAYALCVLLITSLYDKNNNQND
jgi:hypothetical protein